MEAFEQFNNDEMLVCAAVDLNCDNQKGDERGARFSEIIRSYEEIAEKETVEDEYIRRILKKLQTAGMIDSYEMPVTVGQKEIVYLTTKKGVDELAKRGF